jgi:hypothetical protein
LASLKGKRPLGRPKLRWDDNIKIDLKEIGLEGVDLIHQAQYREHGNELSGSIKGG